MGFQQRVIYMNVQLFTVTCVFPGATFIQISHYPKDALLNQS